MASDAPWPHNCLAPGASAFCRLFSVVRLSLHGRAREGQACKFALACKMSHSGLNADCQRNAAALQAQALTGWPQQMVLAVQRSQLSAGRTASAAAPRSSARGCMVIAAARPCALSSSRLPSPALVSPHSTAPLRSRPVMAAAASSSAGIRQVAVKADRHEVDVAVIGGGPGGMAAALAIQR